MDQQYEPQQQPAPMPADTPLTATLTAGEWNIVQAALRELPMKFVEQLTQKIARQVFKQAYEEQQP